MRTRLSILFIILLVSPYLSATVTDSLYREPYRPQYHFTPKHRWIGDPSGLIKFGEKYMAYSWGAVTSDDLVHWNELNDQAIKQVPEGISIFTGSVVIDKRNTAGHGANTPIAAFTSYHESSKKQSQSIAFSHDNGVTFKYYDRNPVLDIWSTEFRDPTVVWDDKNGRWVMIVAKALEKKVAFYSSPDLKHWEWLSEFGPLGDSEKSWECPDMFQMTVDGQPERRKWVLVVSVNWSREQYFVGEFDGVRFVPDSLDYPLYIDNGLDYYASRVFQNYDETNGPVYTIGWLNTWDYAQTAPTTYGKGMWSIPREYRLKETPSGLRLWQLPLAALQTLRGKSHSLKKTLRTGVTKIPFITAYQNTYELDATFSVTSKEPVGFYFCEGDNKRVVLTYDPQSQYITLNRTHVSEEPIPKFERMSHCKVPLTPDNKIRFHCFVDKSSIEIFVNDGEVALSLLTFPSVRQNGCSLFSLGNAEVELTAWGLDSIW